MRKTLPQISLVPALLALLLLLPQTARAADGGTILTGKVVPTVVRAVPMPFNSIINEVLVRPGDEVQAGQPLLRFHLQGEAERILQREITNGAGNEELRGQILDTERQLATMNAERNKTRQLVSSGLGSRQALARLESNVESLQSRIDLLRTMIKKNEANFKSRLKELEEYFGQPLKEGGQLPETMVLASPITGYVLSISPSLNPGQMVAAGESTVQVGQLNPVLIQVPVYEAEINRIKVGDTATVEIPSLDQRKFKGIVSEISWISSDMNVANPSYYTVELTVPNQDLVLKPGFKAVVRFTAGRHAE